jgi:hypothetical protein
VTTWASAIVTGLQILLIVARWLERGRIISEADAVFTARLHTTAREAINEFTKKMDAAAAAAADSSVPDKWERS